MHPLATFALPQSSYANYSASYRQNWSALTDVLPLNVHLLTLDQLGAKDYLIRVEHYFELNEDDTYSRPVTIDLQSIFKSIGTISNTIELILGANLPLADLQRLNWTTTDEQSSQINVPSKFMKQKYSFRMKHFPLILEERSLKDTSVRLTSMQIRTFHVVLA
jgi:hypothetical protein